MRTYITQPLSVSRPNRPEGDAGSMGAGLIGPRLDRQPGIPPGLHGGILRLC